MMSLFIDIKTNLSKKMQILLSFVSRLGVDLKAFASLDSAIYILLKVRPGLVIFK